MGIKFGAEDIKSWQSWRAVLAEFVALLLFVFVGPGAVIAALSVSGGTLNAAGIVAIPFTGTSIFN